MKVGVIGGGLSGIMAAAELARRGADVVVFEAAGRIGGVTRTITEGGFLFEPAGGGFNLPHPALDHFVSEFALDVVTAAGGRRRYLAWPDRLVELPATPPAMLLSPVLSGSAKARLACEPSITSSHGEGESLLGFMTRRFGDEAGRLGAHLAATGVFAGDPSELSIAAAFPRLVSVEQQSGSVLKGMVDARRRRGPGTTAPRVFVPANGMSGMIDQLAAGLDVRCGFDVTSIDQVSGGWRVQGPDSLDVDHVVLAIGPAEAAPIVPEHLASLLQGRPSAPVAVVGIGGRSDLPLPQGLGALSHPDSGLVSLGVLFESSYAPGRAPGAGFLVKVIAGGALRTEVAEWTDDYLVRVVGAELALMLGRSIDADWVRVVRQRIPQYRTGHLNWLSRLDEVTGSLDGLHLTGWGYRGIGISHVATAALAIADRIVSD